MNIRKLFIIDCVDHYKRQYGDEYLAFVEQTKKRREGMLDKELGHLKGEKEFRVGISVPDRLYRMLDIAFRDEEKKFLEANGEMKWFANKYKEFLLPNNY